MKVRQVFAFATRGRRCTSSEFVAGALIETQEIDAVEVGIVVAPVLLYLSVKHHL